MTCNHQHIETEVKDTLAGRAATHWEDGTLVIEGEFTGVYTLAAELESAYGCEVRIERDEQFLPEAQVLVTVFSMPDEDEPFLDE